MNSILAVLPASVPVRLWMGRQHPEDDQLPIALRDGVQLRWVQHADLVPEIRRTLGEVSGWYGWVCVDTATTRELRHLVRTATGAGRRDGHAMGYWTVGRPTG